MPPTVTKYKDGSYIVRDNNQQEEEPQQTLEKARMLASSIEAERLHKARRKFTAADAIEFHDKILDKGVRF